VGDQEQILDGGQWNELTIIAVGNRQIHQINGVTCMDLTDNHPDAKRKGILALQLHAGAPMTVEFKNLELTTLVGRAAKTAIEAVTEGKAQSETPSKPEPSKPDLSKAEGAINLPVGFQVEKLYSVPKEQQGSWVAMCLDHKGRMIVGDQYGGLYRFTPPPAGKKLTTQEIEPLTYAPSARRDEKPQSNAKSLLQIGGAHGLLYAFDSLYVVVNERTGVNEKQGVFRLTDTDGDDQFDKMEHVLALSARGEHGPHSLLLTPDKKHLYLVAGNSTPLPEYDHSRVPELWQEDQLYPSIQHFMRGVTAPRGHIGQMDPDGKNYEIVATGFRNQFDAALNQHGELFTYDADMEWDLNTPWYRPTRINHVIDGADYGWRTGSGKFMDTCSDTFGAAVDVGLGSPTGITFGYGAKFPAKYQKALFACDWSYGKLYAIHLEPNGSTYRGTFEEFASAQPLPLTDIRINPVDGAMYFMTGGRRVQSALFRITYRGTESTAPIQSDSTAQQQRDARHALESFLQRDATQASEEELNKIWKHLGSSDRGLRHAARVALETQPLATWPNRITHEENLWIKTAAMIAYSRSASAGEDQQAKDAARAIQEELIQLDYASLDPIQLRLDVLRALTLSLTRGGQPPKEMRGKLITWLDGIYPAMTPQENRDLSGIMQFLQAPSAATKGMALLNEASGQEEQITYAMHLRHLKEGWTPELRKNYFRWFVLAGGYHGGARLANYLADCKKDAIASVPKSEMTPDLQALVDTPPKREPQQFTIEPRSFVKDWGMADFEESLSEGVPAGRDFKNGRKMFGSGSCYACHRFQGEGGAVGPDLTSAGGKFSAKDLLETVLMPSKAISDQYSASQFLLDDGTQLVGRVMNLKENEYWVNTDMMKPSTIIKLNVDTIEAIRPSKVSMMPEDLINTMNEKDVLDLLAYLISAGDPNHSLFKD
ncbi:MAG: family 16 glycoside hydrolase, partial [Rubripirellula sp.]